MENTSPFLFDNEDEKYFLALQGRAVGPLTAQEVYERIQKGEAGLLSYLWKDGWSDWKRICDEKDFAVLVPQKPSSASINQIKRKLESKKAPAPVAAEEDAKTFYLYFNRSQYGPFSKNELVHVMQRHKLDRNAYLWTAGWKNWKRVAEIDEFAHLIVPPAPTEESSSQLRTLQLWHDQFDKPEKTGKSKKVSKSEKTGKSRKTSRNVEKTFGAGVATAAGIDASEKRGAPRRPLIARLFLHDDKDVIIAVCRDISVGGMQVLTDRVPGPVGTRVKLNVSPGTSADVKSFVAEGEIVRVLEDGRGFSFRFKKISDEAKKAIQKYITTD